MPTRPAPLARRARFPWLAAAVAALGAAAPAQERVVIKDARIIPVNGPEIEKGSILVENGKIAQVGPSVDSPYEATVIDAAGKVVFPGFIEAHCNRGMDRPNEAYPITPFVSVADSIDGSSLEFEDALRDGITSLHVIHGNAQPIAGRGMVVKPLGRIVENMAVVYDAALKISFVPRPFSSHVAQFAEIRRAFDDLDDHLGRAKDKREDEDERAKDEKDKKKDEKAVPKEAKDEEAVDRRKRVLAALVKGKIPVFVACNAAEVPYALEFAKKHGFFDRMTLVLGADAWKVADAVAASGRPVVLDEELIHRERDPITGKEIETAVAPVFAKKNVKFALQRGSAGGRGASSAYTQRYLNMQAALAQRTGLDRETALRAITLWPAEILGLGERLGAIEKGRDANLLILSGDPLSTTTFVEKVLIEGQLVYERDKDERLKRLLGLQEEKK